jgi:hypothetical protein
MTAHPVLPPVLLVVAAVLIAAVQGIALYRWQVGGRERRVLWRWLGLACASVLLLLSATRIVVVTAEQTLSPAAGQSDPNVFLIIDRSPDMAVRDLDGRTRMEIARQDMVDVIERFPGARFAVIGFSSAPALLWPLSADTWSLKPSVDQILPYPFDRESMFLANAGAADVVLRYQLINAGQQYPRAPRLVFYLGAGTPESQFPPRQFDLPSGSVNGGAVLGYGTARGGAIPGTDVTRSPVDASTLEAIAEQLDVPYVPRADTAPLATVLPAETRDAGVPVDAADIKQTETYWIPAILAAPLLLVELFVVLRQLRRATAAPAVGEIST